MADEMDDIKARVKKALVEQKIKLWLVPYVVDQQHPQPSMEAMEALVQQWAEGILFATEDHNQVLQVLQELQFHAIEKKKAKDMSKLDANNNSSNSSSIQNSRPLARLALEIKVLGPISSSDLSLDGTAHNSFASNIKVVGGEKTEDVDSNGKMNSRTMLLRVEGVESCRTCLELFQFMKDTLQMPNNLRFIQGGKNILPTALTLGDALSTTASTTSGSSGTISLLCLTSAAAPSLAATSDEGMIKHADIHARIASIRQAAREMQTIARRLEITDQHGKLVPLSQEDRLGFVTALALHRMGLNCLAKHQKDESLIFLLEADKEWKTHPSLYQTWKDRVDNYGLLQLDIAWLYLQLESLENLPDSLRRLDEAERVLQKQVHKNFVALALAQAEMGTFKEVRTMIVFY